MRRSFRRVLLFARAYARLLHIQRLLIQRGFSGLQSTYLLPWKPGSRKLRRDDSLARDVEWVVNQACAWQFRRTVCLHRATLAYSLLRSCGAQPQFVMAVASRPFASHAWTVLDGEPFADGEMDESRYYYNPIMTLPADSSILSPRSIMPHPQVETAVL